MKGGLFTTSEIAAYFRIDAKDVIRMVEEDDLPAVLLPGKTRPVRKYSAMALHRWVAARSSGQRWGSRTSCGSWRRCGNRGGLRGRRWGPLIFADLR